MYVIVEVIGGGLIVVDIGGESEAFSLRMTVVVPIDSELVSGCGGAVTSTGVGSLL